KPEGMRGAIDRLKYFGRFYRTGFYDVIIGNVPDRGGFFETLGVAKERGDPIWRYIARMVPVDRTFSFTVPLFRERLGEVVDGMAPSVPEGTFYVRIERRGHKGRIPTQEVEREMGERIMAAHAEAGCSSRVDFKEYRSVIAVETFRDEGGVGLILRETLERFPFLRVP
ncbi:MAG TPA: THUMP domain-containing protein, partial [Candidatus Deferrimicrobiaceae bacterium]